jgi:broad specificity phosphatase PhoE
LTTTIILVRHTDVLNPGDVLYGRLPRFRLSELGKRQAEMTASVLAEMPVNVFYSSPQLRARQTAAILRIPHPGVPLHISSLLAEVLTGWEGRPHSELGQIHFNYYDNLMRPTDETLDALWARIQGFVRLFRRRHAGEQVVAVTHGDVCHLARAGYRGLPIEISSIRVPHPYPGKGSLTRFTFSDDLATTYPISIEYCDPNGDDPAWSQRWVKMDMQKALG